MSRLPYFAYGSNMLSRRIVERVPSARRLGLAVLEGYALRWHKVGQDGSGKCDVVQVASARVHGVVYTFDAEHKPLLDAAEGLGRGYEERELSLQVEGVRVSALAYVATATDQRVRPFSWYKALVLGGAIENGLPQDYVASLGAVPAVDDADTARAAHHFALADPVPARAQASGRPSKGPST
jgi:gamma-glutamylcyclotransferase (GGCT)/AIG2-like uncharacterized protein YtfP